MCPIESYGGGGGGGGRIAHVDGASFWTRNYLLRALFTLSYSTDKYRSLLWAAISELRLRFC